MTAARAPRPPWPTRAQIPIGLALIASGAAGAGFGLGAPLFVLGALLAAVAAWCVAVLLRRGRETTLLALAGTSLAPAPQAVRVGVLVATAGLIVGVVLADRLWPADTAQPLEPTARMILGGVVALDACLALSTILSGRTGPLPSFVGAALISTAVMWALYHRARIAGCEPIAAGIAIASVVASLIVLLRLGGLPLIGSSAAGDYSDAKDAVVGELGDVNGQALIVMLGLPFLLAFTLQAGRRVLIVAGAVATALATLSLLVLLSRSSLVGGVVGAGVVTVLMARLSRKRVIALGVVASTAAIYFARGVERISADDKNLGTRSVLWRTAVDFWHQSPLLGHGANSWPRLVEEQVRWAPTGGRGGTHNVLLSGLVSGGLVAAALQVVLIVAVAYLGVRNLRRLRSTGATAAYAAVAGALGAFAAQVARGGFEATGWPGTRANDLQTWAGLLMIGVVVILTTSAGGAGPQSGSPPGDRAVSIPTPVPSVICFSTADWDAPLWTNKQHLMSRLGERGVSVLYLDSLGLRRPGLGHADLRRMAQRVRRWQAYATETAPGVFRDSPLVVPLHRFAGVRAVNRSLLALRLRRNERRLEMLRPVVWAYTPAAAEAYRPDRHQALVYHCVDDLAAYPGIDAASYRAGEARLVRRAGICIASSRPLVEHLQDLGARDVRYWPNPADTETFRLATERSAARLDDRPVIGFIGAVQEHKVDVALLIALARARPHWRFVVAGPVGLGLRDTTLDGMAFPPNVELPGLISRPDLPALIASFDVGIIPYVRNAYTGSVFPMKVFEYLSAGLPVVSTSLPSLVGEVEHVAFADDEVSFAAAIDAALRDAPHTRHVRSGYAEGFSWARRTDQAVALLESLAS